MNKKGQVWITDFMVGLALFMMILFVVLRIFLSMDLPKQSETYIDAVHVSSGLLTQGYPKNWTNDTVIIPGIAKDNMINYTQLEEYATIPYGRTIVLYQLSSDYIFFFSNSTNVINTTRCTYGYDITTDAECNPLLTSISYSDLSKIDRIVVLNDTLVRMTIYAWK